MSSHEMTIPNDLAALGDDPAFRAAREFMAELALPDLRQLTPELQYPSTEAPIGYGVFRPEDGVIDEQEAIVSLFPIANDLGPNMAARHIMLQHSLAKPTQIIAFPHNTQQEPHVYGLTDVERLTIASGTMDPLIERQLQTLAYLGITRVSVIGDSVGSTIGAQFIQLAGTMDAMKMNKIKIDHAVFFEPVNVLRRTVNVLRRNMRQGGLHPFLNAVNESGVPVYSQVQHTRGGLDHLRLIRMLSSFSQNGKLPDNEALGEGLQNDSFAWDATGAMRRYPELDMVIGRGGRSLMISQAIAMLLRSQLQSEFPGRTAMYTAEDRGHEMTNHLPTFVLVAKAALEGHGLALPSTS